MYRQNPIKKISEKNVDYLEYKAKDITVHYSVLGLEQLIKYYTVLMKKLSEGKGIKV